MRRPSFLSDPLSFLVTPRFRFLSLFSIQTNNCKITIRPIRPCLHSISTYLKKEKNRSWTLEDRSGYYYQSTLGTLRASGRMMAEVKDQAVRFQSFCELGHAHCHMSRSGFIDEVSLIMPAPSDSTGELHPHRLPAICRSH